MQLLTEVLSILNEATYKPIIADVGSHMVLAGKTATPETIADLINRQNNLKDIEKEYKELTKKKPIESYAVHKFGKKVHQLIIGLYWYKYHVKGDERTFNNFVKVTGLTPDEIKDVATNNTDDIKQVFKDFKLSWIPEQKEHWVKFTPSERQAIVRNELANLAQGQTASVSGIDLATHVKSKYHLSDDLDSLRKSIDVILSNMPGLDKYRKRGKTVRSDS